MMIVQDVLEKDAGWNWSTFWEMVLHGLEAALQTHRHERDFSSMQFPAPPRYLQPPLSLVQKNVQYCFDRFNKRQEQELKVKDVITKVGAALDGKLG